VAIIVIGGHSRNIGKTSVVASLIARLPQYHWTAFKITQYGHGFCTANGEPCDCQTDDHTLAVSEERSRTNKTQTAGGTETVGGTDTARFLAAGAARSVWVRTRQGMLAEVMPRIRKELASAENAILESNSILQFLKPDLYLSVLDAGTADFKDSARLFLDRADAVLVRATSRDLVPRWNNVSLKLIEDKPQFVIAPPDYMTDDVVDFVERQMMQSHAVAARAI
jgi:molybdopterin-guanine dinucleotide biosynthesis protein